MDEQRPVRSAPEHATDFTSPKAATTRISADHLFSAMEELLAQDRQAAFTVTGMSMWPLMCHGRDKVVVKRCAPDQLHKGEIVLLRTPPGPYLLHRITRIQGDRIETTGDGNCFRDGCFPRDCVRARVVQVVRRGTVIPCQALRWKLLFSVWMLLYPLRAPLLGLLRRISRRKGP